MISKFIIRLRIRDFLSHPTSKNTLWIIGSSVYQMVFSLILGIFTARFLGPENYGVLSFVGSIVALFLPVVSMGLQGVVVYEIIRTKENAGVLLGSAFLIQFISTSISSISIFLILVLFNPGFEFILPISILQIIALFIKCYEIFDYYYQSKLQSKFTALSRIFAVSLVAFYRIFILINQMSIYWFAAIALIESVFIFVAMLYFYIKNKGPKLSVKIATIRALVRDSFHFVISGLMVIIYTQIDKIMIGYLISSEHVGLYTSAVHITEMWIFFPTAIVISARPLILEYKKSDELKYKKTLKIILCTIFWSSFFVSFFVFSFSSDIVNILYGSSFFGSSPSLNILTWATGLSMLGNARGVWILAERKNKYVKYYLFWGMISNIVLNSFLIPIYGMIGAAFATLITQFLVVVVSPLMYRETRVFVRILLEAIAFRFQAN